MKIFFQVIATFLLLYWPIASFFTVMFFDAPGSTGKVSIIVSALVVLFYPLIVGLLFYLFKQTLWGIKPHILLAITFIAPVIMSFVLGYPNLVLSAFRGINALGYAVADGKVYYDGDRIQANPAHLKVFEKSIYWALDDQNVFFRGKVVPGADAKSFHFFKEPSDYWLDKSAVYFQNKKLEGADPAKFSQVYLTPERPTSFFKDQSHVYFLGQKIPDARAESFKAITTSYSADDQNAFYMYEKIQNTDPKTFHAFGEDERLAADQKTVFYSGYPVAGADAKSFKTLDRGYAQDAQNVFCLKQKGESFIVKGANTKTFHVTQWDAATKSEATDGQHFYVDGLEVKTK